MKKEVFPQENAKPAGESCANCRFCINKTCFEASPQVSVLLVPAQVPLGARGGGGPAMQPVPMSAWPPVDRPEVMWCGRWQPQGGQVYTHKTYSVGGPVQ